MTVVGSHFHMLRKATLLAEFDLVFHLKSLNLEVDINIFFAFILQVLVNM